MLDKHMIYYTCYEGEVLISSKELARLFNDKHEKILKLSDVLEYDEFYTHADGLFINEKGFKHLMGYLKKSYSKKKKAICDGFIHTQIQLEEMETEQNETPLLS